jgi:hypothetical protein
MKSMIVMMSAAMLPLLIGSNSLAQGIEFGPGGVRVNPGYGYHHREHYGGYRPDCRALRFACVHKEEMGEEGHGNCQRYRELCQGRGY